MGKRAQLKRHLHTLGEIHDIMTALKNLSLIEIKKLSQFMSAQKTAAADLEEATSDFLSFFPAAGRGEETGPKMVPYLLIGSERGFCGAFNAAVAAKFKEVLQAQSREYRPVTLVVGKKLAFKFPEEEQGLRTLTGPATAEEVPRLVTELITQLTEMGKSLPLLRLRFLTILFNEEKEHGFETSVIRPFERFLQKEPQTFAFPPRLNLAPDELFSLLTDHYLFLLLHSVFYYSLLAEHRQRMQHMEGAVQHLDKEIARLTLRFNELRQEEITEEIEVILLGTEVLSGKP